MLKIMKKIQIPVQYKFKNMPNFEQFLENNNLN